MVPVVVVAVDRGCPSTTALLVLVFLCIVTTSSPRTLISSSARHSTTSGGTMSRIITGRSRYRDGGDATYSSRVTRGTRSARGGATAMTEEEDATASAIGGAGRCNRGGSRRRGRPNALQHPPLLFEATASRAADIIIGTIAPDACPPLILVDGLNITHQQRCVQPFPAYGSRLGGRATNATPQNEDRNILEYDDRLRHTSILSLIPP